MAESVRIYEVAPRDGLQNEPEFVATADKLRFIEGLADAGYSDIEVGSFVRPRWIPQLADTADLVRQLPKRDGVTYWALVPNRRGLERALDAGMEAVATFLSASETHNKKNLNRTVRETLAVQRELVGTAGDESLRVRAYISTVFGCPYEGAVDPARPIALAEHLLAAGAETVVLGDTTGMAHPEQVKAMVARFAEAGVPLDRLALHLHDTRGTALANCYAGWLAGIRTFDGSVAGLGGCPYAPGAAGNASSEDLIYMFQAMGVSTGIDLDTVCAAGVGLSDVLGRDLPGRYHRYYRGSRPEVGAVKTA